MKKILSIFVLIFGFSCAINASSYKVSFLPSDGMSSYTIKHTDGSGVTYTVGANDQRALEIDITRESLAYIELSLDRKEVTVEGKKYVFFGWINENGDHISYSENFTGVFASEVTVKPDFIPAEWAHYVIKSDRNIVYYDLNKAIAKAEIGTGEGKIVVVHKDGLLPKGNYTIPNGVTLLVPGDDGYTCKEELEVEDFKDENQPSSPYRTWTIESGAHIDVAGKICIYSKLICYSGVVFGRPYQYGHIVMQDDTRITLQNSSRLSAFGYVTGSLQSTIEAKSGAKIYECFQVRDWRGGSATAKMVLDNYSTNNFTMAGLLLALKGTLWDGTPSYEGVFPLSHYYVQNIETPLLLRNGASENVVTGVDIGTGLNKVSITFVGSEGLFVLGDGSSLIKYYDVSTDRMKYIVRGDTDAATAKFGTITLPVTLTGDVTLDINSKDYTLPIAHNMDLRLENIDISIQDNFALLAGSTLLVDKSSKVTINGGGAKNKRWNGGLGFFTVKTDEYIKTSSIFVYDKEWNNGYFGMSNASLLTVGERPGGLKYARTTVEDAMVVVDGTIELSQYGWIYTTSGENCGANITSNGGGSIKYAALGTATKTLQASQSNTSITYVDIPVTNAVLRNADGTYQTPAANTTYYYCGDAWGTTGGCEKAPDPLDYTPLFTASECSITAYVEEGPQTTTLSITEENRDNALSRTYSAEITGRDAHLFSYDIATKTVTFNPASAGTKTATLILTAINTTTNDKHTQAISLIGNALNYEINTLAFNDLSTVYAGKQNISLFKDKNSNADITITVENNEGEISVPTAEGLFNAIKEGEVKITLSQPPYNHIAATSISTTLTINPRVVWNWSELYYPSVNTNPVSILDGTSGWTLTEIIDSESGDVVKFTGTSPDYQAEIFDLVNGEYKVQFKFEQEEYESIIFDSEIYRDPRAVRVDVNEERTYKAVTVGAVDGVTYKDDDKTISIISGNQTNSWTIHFIGIPDKLYFTPIGNKAWLIEESQDGFTWETTSSWAYLNENIQFEHSLQPSTQYVRISYAANGTGTLRDVYITKLEGVKLWPNKLYMPAVAAAKKALTLTYVSDTKLSISDPNGMFTANPSESSASTTAPYYKEVSVEIENNSCLDEKLVNMNIVSSSGTVQLPIQTYQSPQPLPIVLAADHKERFYYVTSEAIHTTWNEETRTITMHNTLKDIPNVSPSMTFYYQGYPSYISFNHTEGVKGEWKIEEYKDNRWTSVTANRETTSTYLKQPVSETAQYLRVTYVGLHAEKVDITNLMIIGAAGAFATPTELQVEYVSDDNNSNNFSVTAINLVDGMTISIDNPNFALSHGSVSPASSFTLTSEDYADVFAENVMKAIGFKAYFNGSKAVDYATITVNKGTTSEVLATIKVTGVRKTLTNGVLNIYTGVHNGKTGTIISNAKNFDIKGSFVGYEYRPVDISHAFADNTALFDYLFVFGETTTIDGTAVINTPTTIAGSNAKTPCYIYKKNEANYEFVSLVENVNASAKITQDFLKLTNGSAETLKVYITGFCPYASTGYTKQDEGVFFFQGDANDHVHVYLEDCYIYSRSKTLDGHYFENRSDGLSFTEDYVQGSGGVLVFECTNSSNQGSPLNVTIHTRGTNMFKSHYGCFLESVAGRAFQVSSPVQVHMKTSDYITNSYTILNFDDIWPISSTETERTNGFLSLQKQVNNAPSIDMGNANTVVNFNGGQVELQNAQNVSDNYESTLAISHRLGTFAGFRLAYGLGSDGVGGTVNFKDGTTTVLRMEVSERYRQYYLMDVDDPNTQENESVYTSCLRCPKNTYVYGGSHCMMRACSEPTSKGGAPKSGPEGVDLGLYKYPKNPADGKKGGWSLLSYGNGLVDPTSVIVPTGYSVNSVTPNTNGTTDDLTDDYLNFWVPAGYDDNVVPEIDQKISFWKACMTEISANYAGYGGVIGGDTEIATDGSNQTELVSNLLYCAIDQDIHEEISKETYSAPVKSPLPSGDPYLYVAPTSIGESYQHYVANEKSYRIENKIYYIITAKADVWMTFTAPFDVENIYVMETYSENKLYEYSCQDWGEENPRQQTIKYQARHNADFAAFFGVAMAIHPNKTFDMIYNDYIGWAKLQDQNILDNDGNPLYSGNGTYDVRGKYPLVPYQDNNWDAANCYIYHNTENWKIKWGTIEEDGDTYQIPTYETNWEELDEPVGRMMTKGESYSILLPYCVGCDNSESDREEWDYWSGKFLIFESTDGPHEVEGGTYVGTVVEAKERDPRYDETKNKYLYTFGYDYEPTNEDEWVFDLLKQGWNADEALLTGNSTFAKMGSSNEYLFTYISSMNNETFDYAYGSGEIEPTTSFMLANPPIDPTGMPAKSISRDGRINYGKGNTPSGTQNGNIPTINGGSDIFVTEVVNGINIAVATPQYVRVLSSSGAMLYSGMVESAVDVNLPNNGIYVVAGENTSLKIMY